MRLTLVSHEYPPIGGGASTALQQIATRLAVRGHAVQVLSIGTGWKTTTKLTGPNLEVVRLGVGRKRILAPNILELLVSCFGLRFLARKHVQRFAPDCLCAFFAFPAGYAVRSLARSLGIPLVISLRGSDVPGFSSGRLGAFGKVLPRLFATAMRDASLCIANGTRLADLAAPFAGDTPIRIIPNGVDTDLFHPREGQQNPAVRLLFVGQFIARKRCLEFVEALAALPAKGPELEVTLVGAGPQEPLLRKIASAMPARVAVHFAGFMDREQMPATYREHDLLVHLSRSEGVSNVLLEALSSGLAVLASPDAVDGSLAQIKGLRILNDQDLAQLSSVLEELIGNRDELDRMRGEARTAALGLNWDARIDEYEAAFRGEAECPGAIVRSATRL